MRYKHIRGCTFGADSAILGLETMSRTSTTTRRGETAGQPGRARRVLRGALVACAVLLLVESLFGERGLTAMFEARRQHDAVQASLDRLRDENARLRHQARRLREDPAAIEEVARRDLRLIAPGEKVFIIKDARPPQ